MTASSSHARTTDQFLASLNAVSGAQTNLRSAAMSLDEASSRLSKSADLPSLKNWFVVLASYDPTQNGLTLARKRLDQLAKAGNCAEIWRSKTTDKYAVVSGSIMPQGLAQTTANTARSNGLAADAYVVPNQDWTQIAPQPAGCSSP